MKRRKLSISIAFSIGVYVIISMIMNLVNKSPSIDELTFVASDRERFDSFVGKS